MIFLVNQSSQKFCRKSNAVLVNLQKGVSLLELMLVLIVIGVLLLLATRYFQQARENLRVAQAVEIINNVVNGSYKWLEGKPNFSGISVTTLTDDQFLPGSYKNSNANPWFGAIAVTAANNNSNISISLTGIPSASCRNLLEKMKTKDTFSAPVCNPSTGAPATFSVSF